MPGLIRRLPVVAGLAVLALLALATPASAHADLTTSDPSNGTVVRSEPAAVTLHYSEEVTLRLSTIRVIGPDGGNLVAGPVRFGGDASVLTVPLRQNHAQGTYIVVWHAVAADDGHATSGVVMFAVGHRSPTSMTGLSPGDSGGTAQVLMEIAVWLGFAGFALLAGQFTVRVAARLAGASPPVPLRPAVIGWVTLLVATLGQLLCYGPYAAGQDWRQALNPGLLADTLATTTGRDLMARAVLLVLLAVIGEGLLGWISSTRSRPLAVTAGAVVVLCLAGTWVPISHAASGSWVPLALAATTLHVAAMGTWAGGVVTLLPLLRAPAPAPVRPAPVGPGPERTATIAQPRPVTTDLADRTATVRRFSTLAFGSVCLLAVTGVVQGWHDLGGLGALTGTSFGRLLLLKIGILILVLVVASRSRAIVGRRLGDGLAALRGTVRLELAGLGVLLVVVTLLINTAPPPH